LLPDREANKNHSHIAGMGAGAGSARGHSAWLHGPGGTKVTVADYPTSRLAEKQALHLLAANAQRRSVPSGDATTRTAPAGRT